MKVIAGSLKGRELLSPKRFTTHPMSEKIRGALFNVLGDIEELRLLDAFSGSGSLAIEALSRGAKYVVAIEHDPQAYKTVKHNIDSMGLSKFAEVHRMRVQMWSKEHPEELFDVVLCDPPHDKPEIAIIQNLVSHVQSSGVLVLSWPQTIHLPELLGCILLRSKIYGNAQVGFYRRLGGLRSPL